MTTTRYALKPATAARRTRLVRAATSRPRRRSLPDPMYRPKQYMLYTMVDGEYWSQPTDGTPPRRLDDDQDDFLEWLRARRRR